MDFTDNHGQPPPNATDPVGMWYVARARHGIGDNIWFGFAHRAGDREAIAWSTVPHREADGIGALTRLLEARGFRGGEMPTGKDMRPPSLRAIIAGWRQRPRSRQQQVPRWRFLDPQRAALAHDTPPACCFLRDEEYAALRAAARRARVSTTTWLLWSADRATRAVLAEGDAVLPWVFPVNLRGAVPTTNPCGNLCSGLTVELAADTTPVALAEQVRARFAAQEHWRQWLLLTLGRRIGQRGVDLLYRYARGRAGSHAGSYSNLGCWPLPGMDAPPGDDITGVTCTAPGSPAYPVSVGMVDWRGRLALTCRVHPVAAPDATVAEHLLAVWRSVATGG